MEPHRSTSYTVILQYILGVLPLMICTEHLLYAEHIYNSHSPNDACSACFSKEEAEAWGSELRICSEVVELGIPPRESDSRANCAELPARYFLQDCSWSCRALAVSKEHTTVEQFVN